MLECPPGNLWGLRRASAQAPPLPSRSRLLGVGAVPAAGGPCPRSPGRHPNTGRGQATSRGGGPGAGPEEQQGEEAACPAQSRPPGGRGHKGSILSSSCCLDTHCQGNPPRPMAPGRRQPFPTAVEGVVGGGWKDARGQLDTQGCLGGRAQRSALHTPLSCIHVPAHSHMHTPCTHTSQPTQCMHTSMHSHTCTFTCVHIHSVVCTLVHMCTHTCSEPP